MEKIISKATKENWEKLKVEDFQDKLKKRANKTMSKKTFVPEEYLKKNKNKKVVKEIVRIIRNNDISLQQAIHSLGINLLKKYDISGRNKFAYEWIEKNKKYVHPLLIAYELPLDEHDILGLIYQSLQYEGDKNIKGSYYTPHHIVLDILKNHNFDRDDIVLDPACGSGSFLISLPDTILPENIIGFDNDRHAADIAVYNLFIRYPNVVFKPNIYTLDFIHDKLPIEGTEIDHIITNPPWGAKITMKKYSFLKSKESFSMFLMKSQEVLKTGGELSFLLPKSFLNVNRHKSIRKIILEKTTVKSIKFYANVFDGVVTDVLSLHLSNEQRQKNQIRFDLKNDEFVLTPQEIYFHHKSYNILPYNAKDQKLLKKAFKNPYYTLEDSLWGLGIVTGDNKKKLSQKYQKGWEPIYTGTDIERYKLKDSKHYIYFDRNQLQQVAPDEIYRAKEKLVYRYISNDLVFAYDDTGSLFLNSANILIPTIPTMSTKTVLAFLNSNFMKYIYKKLFDELRTLKGNLIQLPFPRITVEENTIIDNIVTSIINGQELDEILQKKIYKIYGLEDEEIKYIEKIVY